MSDSALHVPPAGAPHRPKLDHSGGRLTVMIFGGALVAGLAYTAFSLYQDYTATGVVATAYLPFVLLGVALVIALGFEFVNGFHDTANAVATVIYTNSMPANVAVIWSGFFNFLGVIVASGAVAFGIISLLPVELILQVGSGAGFAMVFALLIAAIIWNLSTWALGLPASSSHTLIGSIIGVGIANSLLMGGDGTSGVDWGKATEIGWSLLLSPLIGFGAAAILLLILKFTVRDPALYEAPKGDQPPPWWIRLLLIGTCTGVSFAHGSNDGQKGMGLIMLILIGTVPMAYALNRSVPDSEVVQFQAVAATAEAAFQKQAGNVAPPADVRAEMTRFIRDRKATPETLPALGQLSGEIGRQVAEYGGLNKVPTAAVSNMRNDMYLASEGIRFLDKAKAFNDETAPIAKALKADLDDATKFIPFWVKVAVAIALGLGTMVGWKRIVITVGEKIGKTHLTYAQGASAELVAAVTIGAADVYGLPVSTTHVLSSGVAGTMAANRSGLQLSTIRNLLMAWVLTLPVAMALSAGLYVLFHALFV
ncbi:Low-affinity inorganic phosphate transporter 1 [Alphaproteobacteria bacterium SO-S41]|nr:Low-affinity inorganic phosphate transporter 1 [Alphaproteobacteria bacterium SO-S41]